MVETPASINQTNDPQEDICRRVLRSGQVGMWGTCGGVPQTQQGGAPAFVQRNCLIGRGQAFGRPVKN